MRRTNAHQQREPAEKDPRQQYRSQGDEEATTEQNQQIGQAETLEVLATI
jgi:hypothetical protein